MSQKPRRRDRLLEKFLPDRRRSSQHLPPPAASASVTLPGNGTADSSPPILQDITLNRVLDKLTEEQQQTLRNTFGQTSSDVSDALGVALIAAEQKKQICVSRRWTLAVGSTTISSKEKVDRVIAFLDKYKTLGSTVASADPIHAGLPWAGVSLLLQVAVSEKHQMDALMNGVALALSMKNILDVYLQFYQKQPPGMPAKTLENALLELYATILSFLADAIRLTDKSHLARFWKALTDDGELGKFASLCRDAERSVEAAADNCDCSLDEVSRSIARECKDAVHQVLDNITNLKQQTDRIELNTNFAKLQIASTCAFNSIDEERLPRCLANTRVQLQEDIERWIQKPNSATFFWLQGVAGTGKSTVARTIANTLHDHGLLGASFFFKRNHAERGNADLFFSSIAVQLAKVIPGLGSEMGQVLEPEFGVYKKGIASQFDDLLLGPMSRISGPPQVKHPDLFILLDALDECDDMSDRKGDTKQMLQLLSRLKHIPQVRLRMIVTSRLEFPVELGFAQMDNDEHQDLVLHEIPSDHIEHDIRIFFQNQLNSIRLDLTIRRKREVLDKSWPGDAALAELTQRSVPLFIFASTVCRFVADDRFAPQAQLQRVLDNREPLHLDSTYSLILNSITQKSDLTQHVREALLSDFRVIVGLIIFSTEPPSATTISSLLDFPIERVEAILDSLHSVLDVTADVNRPIRPFHLSFIEFLARPEVEHEFMIREPQCHAMIADKCLSFLMQPGMLKKDLCSMHDPDAKRFIQDEPPFTPKFSPEFVYACTYWVHHLYERGPKVDDDHPASEFLHTRFLYWFEAMTWLGEDITEILITAHINIGTVRQIADTLKDLVIIDISLERFFPCSENVPFGCLRFRSRIR